MDVHRRRGGASGGGGRRKGATHVEHEQAEYHAFPEEEEEEEKYHSRPPEAPRSAVAAAGSGASWAAYVEAYLTWLYDWLPAWSAFAWLLRYGPREEQFELSPDMQDRVDRFKVHIGAAWAEEEPEHLALLQRYWALCFPNFGFLRRDKRWTEVGFQGPDPGTDFRGGELRAGIVAPGVLSSDCAA